MRPASSLIVFTTLTGAGYGLLFWLGLGAGSDLLEGDRIFAAASLGLALLAVAGGLIGSLRHLGRPERAWRALSQWRSSWLSREGIMALVTFLPALVFAGGWVLRGVPSGMWRASALLSAACAAATVVCTAQIYRTLRPVAQWNTGLVPGAFLALAAMTGAVWLAALCAVFDVAAVRACQLAFAATAAAAGMKLIYWRHIDRRPGTSTAESATGLGALGQVRLFESPHTSENYLLKEMGFAVARKHRSRLRRIAFQLAFVVPLLLILLAITQAGTIRAVLALCAAPLATLGVLLERWLFFAEATHTVTLYYGAQRA